jgi:hypothetical protein
MITSDNPTKARSNLDSWSRVEASKYLKGDKYLRKSRFLFKADMMERN